MNQLFPITNEPTGHAAVLAFHVAYEPNSFLVGERTNDVSVRLTRAAGLLEPGAFLGWQVELASFSGCVFASPDADVTAEDQTWLFQPCGSVSTEPVTDVPPLFEQDRFVYVLSSAAADQPGQSRSDDDFEDTVPTGVLRDLLQALQQAGARLCTVVGSGKKSARGCLLISLPHPMPLRLKSMFSIVFPRTMVLPVHVAQDEPPAFEPLKDFILAGVVRCLLAAVMRLLREADPEEDLDELPQEDLDNEPNSPPDADAGTPLEALDLSVRSFCCLKRAGYVTVEQVRALPNEKLMLIRNLSRKCVNEIHEKLENYLRENKSTADQDEWESLEPEAPQPVDHRLLLENLIGLKEAKEQVARITAFARMKQAFSAAGKEDLGVALNMAFVGNPGTAKTTVARLVAGLLHEIGLLPESEILEVGRADLVARYVGQTATRVKNVFEKVKGRVLFIDEAYSLLDDRADSFGDEAIHTIVQEMENHRHETVVIFAGYPDKMKAFLDRNPGLRSRVPFKVCFDDYSAEELVQIVEAEAKKRGFTVSEEACAKVNRLCLRAAGRPEGGNGRFCRNLVENAILNYAVRVYGDGSAIDGGDCALRPEDFAALGSETDARPIPIGFCA